MENTIKSLPETKDLSDLIKVLERIASALEDIRYTIYDDGQALNVGRE